MAGPTLTAPGNRLGWALRVNGGNFTARIPLDVGAIRITESLGSPAQMEFTIEDTRGTANLPHGCLVSLERLRVNAAGETFTTFRYFGGHLIESTLTRLPGQHRRLIRCRAVGFESWLDWKGVPNYSSRTNVDGRVRQVHSDRAIVQELVSRYGALLSAGPYVDATNTGMQVVSVKGVTLREALERVADVATVISPEATRDFYVDHYGRLHYYSGSEGLDAPFRIADGSYTQSVLAEGGLAGLFTLAESEGTTANNAAFPGIGTGTFNGSGITRNTQNIVWNEPGMSSTKFIAASFGFLSVIHDNFHPGDTFTVECVFKRNTLGTAQTIVSAGSGDYYVGFNASNKLLVQKEGIGDHFVSDDTFTDANPHHFMWTRAPGDSDFYVDGVALSGTTTARTFVSAAPAQVCWGKKVSTNDTYLDGWLSHLAHYTTQKTAADALAHYNQFKSLAPEGIEYSLTSADRVHRVYVRGANAQGSGWVDPGTGSFAGYNVDAFLDEPDSTNIAKRNAYGRAFIRQHGRMESLRLSLTHAFSGWALGQLVHIYDAVIGLNTNMEIRELSTDFNLGNGQISYEMVLGDPRPATFHRGRRRRKRS